LLARYVWEEKVDPKDNPQLHEDVEKGITKFAFDVLSLGFKVTSFNVIGIILKMLIKWITL